MRKWYYVYVMAGEVTDWIPNYELGGWGQTIERWFSEGLPQDQSFVGRMDMFQGESLFKLDRRNFAKLDLGMSPAFEYKVIKEDNRCITARHEDGMITKALKTGTVRNTRMSMDAYLEFPVKDRATWYDVKRRYDPEVLWRYPFWWDEKVRRKHYNRAVRFVRRP